MRSLTMAATPVGGGSCPETVRGDAVGARSDADLVPSTVHERKRTGTYFTPPSLVEALLDSALDPVLEEALQQADPETAILNLKICDPACGSGNFLAAAGRRIARRLAAVRSGRDEPAAAAVQQALRDTVSRCLYGVDLNPAAAELCRETLAGLAGEPPAVLERHVRVGNSLLGATPATVGWRPPYGQLAPTLRWAGGKPPRNPWDEDLASLWARADACCAALTRNHAGPGSSPPGLTPAEIRRLASEHGFFHWHLGFPEIFAVPTDGEPPTNPLAGWSGGFAVVVTNPPWSRIKLRKKDFFATRSPAIAAAENAAARKTLMATLPSTDPELWSDWEDACRQMAEARHLIRASGRFPLCGTGDLNTYRLFVELCRHLLAPGGRAGLIVPVGIATDYPTRHLLADLLRTRTLVSLYGFAETRRVFPATDSREPFALVTVAAPDRPAASADVVFDLSAVGELADPERHVALNRAHVALLNPNTGTCPTFSSRRDAEIVKGIHQRFPIFLRDGDPAGNPWGVSLRQMFHMANDSGIFRTFTELESARWKLSGNVFHHGSGRYLPLYEGKMIRHFNHRSGDYRDRRPGYRGTALPAVPGERLRDPDHLPLPRYWVPAAEVEARLSGRWDRGWLLGWRAISRAANVRTLIPVVVPRVACANTLLLAFPQAPARELVASCLSSFVVDYVLRQKYRGNHPEHHVVKQLPILPPAVYFGSAPWAEGLRLSEWFLPRILELTYTAWDLRPFARDCGYEGPPFGWDDELRFLLRCEIDAAYFHLYGLARDDVNHVMDTFTIVKRRDAEQHGDYRTKAMILEIYDRMTGAVPPGRIPRRPQSSGGA